MKINWRENQLEVNIDYTIFYCDSESAEYYDNNNQNSRLTSHDLKRFYYLHKKVNTTK